MTENWESYLKQQKENEDHGGGGRVGRACSPVPVDAADEVIDAQKKTEKWQYYDLLLFHHQMSEKREYLVSVSHQMNDSSVYLWYDIKPM